MKIRSNRPGILWQSILVFLIIMDGSVLFISVISDLRIISLQDIAIFDLIVVLILLMVFIWRISQNEDKLNYIKRNWTDIIALIPVYFIAFDLLGITGNLIILKVLNLIRIFAFYLFAQKIGKEVIKYQQKTRLVYALAYFLAVLFFCSYIFYLAEHSVNPQVTNFEDSLWFVLQTITTVGYGDIIPVTGVGRLMGVISMFSALVLTSIVTSVATFSLIEKFRKGTRDISKRTKESVEDIDKRLDDMNTRLNELEKLDDLTKNVKNIKSEMESLKEMIKDKKY